MRLITTLLCVIALAACTAQPTPVYHADSNPETLGEWGQVSIQGGALRLSQGVTPYDLNTPLFTDYAQKLRTVWIPNGQSANYAPDENFDFPIGTVITKTFYYAKGSREDHVLKDHPIDIKDGALPLADVRLIETRILVRRDDGWGALPYVWNADQTEARLKRTGNVTPLTLIDGAVETDFSYIVPNTNQCAGCHATNNITREIRPIGPKARHLDKDFPYSGGAENQLTYWQRANLLAPFDETPQPNAVWDDAAATIDARARAYLDMNCSHCHSETGPALTSGLHLTPETPMGPHLGRCKTPIAAGRGTGNRKFSIIPGDPDASILPYRMASDKGDIMMPELGRSLIHAEGVALIREWIAQMDGSCG